MVPEVRVLNHAVDVDRMEYRTAVYGINAPKAQQATHTNEFNDKIHQAIAHQVGV